jgi:hypothetical protein
MQTPPPITRQKRLRIREVMPECDRGIPPEWDGRHARSQAELCRAICLPHSNPASFHRRCKAITGAMRWNPLQCRAPRGARVRP